MPEVGDRIALASNKIGQSQREGIVRATVGSLITVEWSNGEESRLMPSPGAITVLGRSRRGARASTKAAPKKAAPKKAPAKKAPAKKAPAKKAPAKKAPAKKGRR